MALAAFGFDIFHDIYICLYLHYLIFLNQKGVDLLHFWHLPEINSELEIVINQQTVRAWLLGQAVGVLPFLDRSSLIRVHWDILRRYLDLVQ